MARGSLPASGPLDLVDEVPLGDDEKAYVAAARAANTLRGYRSDWAEWCSWCAQEGLDPLAGERRRPSRVTLCSWPAPGTVGRGRPGRRVDHDGGVRVVPLNLHRDRDSERRDVLLR